MDLSHLVHVHLSLFYCFFIVQPFIVESFIVQSLQVRKEYEMLRIEFEQNLAANEQTGPINKEMRNLITSLQTHNVQLKGEVAR